MNDQEWDDEFADDDVHAADGAEEDGLRSWQYDDRPKLTRRGRGCLSVLIALALVVVVGWVGGNWVVDRVKARFGNAPDYPGPGTGRVVFRVRGGDTPIGMARSLRRLDVVKSERAFTDAAKKDGRVTGIQVGYYTLKKHMKASEAVSVLVNPKNLIRNVVAIPEGSRVRDVVKLIAAHTKISAASVTAALRKPQALGLPPQARGNPEGYLAPATYDVPPGTTATGLLRQMVAKSRSVDNSVGLDAGARKAGLTSEQVLTMASILEYEANRSQDYPKVARVLYNRLHRHLPLALDSTVSYVSGRSGDVWTTAGERANDSAYNTYKHVGLPPGPIGSPGEETIRAALHPASGNWLYFLPDFQHGTTLFYASDTPQRQADLKRIKRFCQQSSKC